LDAAEAPLELLHLAPQLRRFLLATLVELAVRSHLGDVRQALYGLTDGLEVGEHASQPALVDVRHAAARGLGLHCLARRALGADEEHGSAVRDDALDEV